jgi:hypothetical protein
MDAHASSRGGVELEDVVPELAAEPEKALQHSAKRNPSSVPGLVVALLATAFVASLSPKESASAKSPSDCRR